MALEEVFDCETLIAEVENRPELYDFQLKEYSDRNVKEKFWTEVFEAAVTDWSNLSPGERKEKGNTIYFIERKPLFTSKFYVTPACLSLSVCLSVSLYVCMYARIYVCVCMYVSICSRVCLCMLHTVLSSALFELHLHSERADSCYFHEIHDDTDLICGCHSVACVQGAPTHHFSWRPSFCGSY